MEEMADSYWIGELAERSGVSPYTIRYYERVGVLPEPERTASGYRVYGDPDLERLEFVQRAKALGLTLEEITEILDLAEAGVEPCDHVRDRLRERLAQVERSIRELGRLRDRLKDALSRAESAAPPGSCRCRIIEGPDGPSVEIGGGSARRIRAR